jgi:hypothetical protein
VAEGTVMAAARVPADLWRAVRHAALDAGIPAQEAVRQALSAWLDRRKTEPFDAPRARWVDMGSTGWAAADFPTPVGEALLSALARPDGTWLPRVQVAGAVLDGPPLRSRTAAMLEAEAQAAALTLEAVAALAKRQTRRGRGA